MPCTGWGTEFPSVLTALYFAGANFNAADQSGNTPLHLAAMENQVPTLLELIKYGAKLNWANTWQQRTPLGMAMLVIFMCMGVYKIYHHMNMNLNANTCSGDVILSHYRY